MYFRNKVRTFNYKYIFENNSLEMKGYIDELVQER